ncbi:MAG: plastocyanin/azurin family copper-binding protein [Gammaproteobacteria bacterium]|nr:plastocyanin/azurin family copper-binding protein [Gammaproteobacteria bacterium]
MRPCFKSVLLLLVVTLGACSDSDTGPDKSAQSTAATSPEKDTAAAAPEKISAPVAPASSEDTGKAAATLPDNGVVYQEAIYANWPYTETAEDIPAAEPAPEPAEQAPAAPVASKTHTINAEARVFNPEIIYINPGDTVQWVNMTSHNSVSVDNLLPEGATPWQSKLGENLKLKLDIEGIYPYVCVPHIGFGMVGVIVVGKPDNLDQVMADATGTLEGPYRRLIGKLKKVTIPQ